MQFTRDQLEEMSPADARAFLRAYLRETGMFIEMDIEAYLSVVDDVLTARSERLTGVDVDKDQFGPAGQTMRQMMREEAARFIVKGLMNDWEELVLQDFGPLGVELCQRAWLSEETWGVMETGTA